MTEKEDPSKQEDLSPEDVARLDKARYKEPGRDLTATRPVEGGAGRDEDNPTAAEPSHGSVGPDGLEGTRGARHLDRRKA